MMALIPIYLVAYRHCSAGKGVRKGGFQHRAPFRSLDSFGLTQKSGSPRSLYSDRREPQRNDRFVGDLNGDFVPVGLILHRRRPRDNNWRWPFGAGRKNTGVPYRADCGNAGSYSADQGNSIVFQPFHPRVPIPTSIVGRAVASRQEAAE